MIHEIVNYVKHLKENSPRVFEQGLEPSKGLHIFVELDKNGNAINFPGEKGVNWDYYDGKESSNFLKNIIPFEQKCKRIGKGMNKVFDKKKQLVSCSPYLISFKKDKLQNVTRVDDEKIIKLLPFYFKKSIEECVVSDDESEKIILFKNFITENLSVLLDLSIVKEMKKDNFINIYFKNASFEQFKKAHNNYLKRNLFNKNDFNTDKEISGETFGLSGFLNGLNVKKPFLAHRTASMFKGLGGRIQAEDTIYLNDFDLLLKQKPKIFPQPLPIFIDKDEFNNSDEILKIFQKDVRLTYNQILKKIFQSNSEILLQNYYLLFFNYKYALEDCDFVSKFRYSLKENNHYPEIKNLFKIKEKNEIKPDRYIKNIFQFEADIVKTIFNNSLVKIKNDSYSVNYFGEVKAEYVSGGDVVYQTILKYRKAFYDYIYKSKTQAITSLMWDEVIWSSILGDLRNDKIVEKGHSKNFSIKEKLNIWFSLYKYFINNKEREDMASKIPKLLEKMKDVANNENMHFATTDEFAFGAGQIIYFLLNQSRASERTHALLEPFIQKVKIVQLQNSIAQAINNYKHELSFGQGRFERLSAEVLGFETDENLKKFQRLLLAGYFATPVIYEKKNAEHNDKEGGK